MSEVLGYSMPGGKIRNLAVFSKKPSSKLQGVPSLTELGVKGAVPEGPWQGIVAPKGLSDDIRNILIAAVGKATQDPSWKGFLEKFGYSDLFLSGKEFEQFFKNDTEMLEGLLRSTGAIK